MSCTAARPRSRSLNIVSLSDMIEGSYRSWNLYTTGQLVDGLQQKKKENRFPLNGNGIMSSFSRATILSFHPVYITSQMFHIWFFLYKSNLDQSLGPAVRVFTNDLCSIPGRVIPKTQKMALDDSLLNTRHYKVWIKGKVEQSKERSSVLPYSSVS